MATRSVILVLLFVALIQPTNAGADELYFIDAHSQVDHKLVPLDKVIFLMNQGGVRHTILSARGKLKAKDLLVFSSNNRKKITPAVRTKGKPYEAASPRYFKQLKAQLASGKYAAIAEVLMYHAQKGDKAPEVVVYPEDMRILTALEYAIDNRWPFVVHIEFGALHGEQKKRFMHSLETMLDNYSEQPFVLTHMGQLLADECRRLIANHENIYFHTGWTNPAAVSSSNQPWVNVFEGEYIAPEWRDLFLQYPQRFVFALDNVFAEHWTGFYLEQMQYWKKALEALPDEVAQLIAHGNAERLWRIRPEN
jgi:predicted TIM-barrel fold metal-dependent hydrolase